MVVVAGRSIPSSADEWLEPSISDFRNAFLTLRWVYYDQKSFLNRSNAILIVFFSLP